MHHHIDRHPHRYKYITSLVEPNSAKSISNLKKFRAECWNGISVELGFPLCFDLFLCGTHYTMHQSNKHFWAFFSLPLPLSVSKIRFVINYLFKIGIQTIRRRIFSIQKKWWWLHSSLDFTHYVWLASPSDEYFIRFKWTNSILTHLLYTCSMPSNRFAYFDGGINWASQFNYITIIIRFEICFNKQLVHHLLWIYHVEMSGVAFVISAAIVRA